MEARHGVSGAGGGLAVYATVEPCTEALAVRNIHQLNIFVYDNETA